MYNLPPFTLGLTLYSLLFLSLPPLLSFAHPFLMPFSFHLLSFLSNVFFSLFISICWLFYPNHFSLFLFPFAGFPNRLFFISFSFHLLFYPIYFHLFLLPFPSFHLLGIFISFFFHLMGFLSYRLIFISFSFHLLAFLSYFFHLFFSLFPTYFHLISISTCWLSYLIYFHLFLFPFAGFSIPSTNSHLFQFIVFPIIFIVISFSFHLLVFPSYLFLSKILWFFFLGKKFLMNFLSFLWTMTFQSLIRLLGLEYTDSIPGKGWHSKKGVSYIWL